MGRLKHSAAEWCYFRKSHEANPLALYRQLKLAGYDALEMVAEPRWPLVKEAGLKLLNIGSPGMQDGLNRVENHATLLPAIRERIAKCRANEISDIIVFSGSRKGLSDAEGIRNCAVALRQLAAEAEDAEVTLLLEVLNVHDHPDYQCDNGRYAFEVAAAVNSPRVKVLYDIYHMHRMGEPLLQTITQHLSSIGHLHVAGSPQRGFPGPDQTIDYRALVQKVTAAGYSGYWGQEFRGGDDPVTEFSDAVRLFESHVA